MQRHSPVVLLALLLLTGHSTKVWSTTVIPPTFDELAGSASRIVVTEVVKVEPRIDTAGGHRVIVTTVTFRSLRDVKGETPRTFDLQFLGGTVGDETLEIVGTPRWVVGDRDVLFTSAGTSRLSPLIRMMHGRVRVRVDPAGIETVALHSGVPIGDVAAFGRADTPTPARAMSLAAFIDAVEARLQVGK